MVIHRRSTTKDPFSPPQEGVRGTYVSADPTAVRLSNIDQKYESLEYSIVVV
jgi:hypothetical protein